VDNLSLFQGVSRQFGRLKKMFATKPAPVTLAPAPTLPAFEPELNLEKLLCQNAYIKPVRSGPVHEYHVTTFAANEPIEDRFAISAERESNDFLFGVYDGHGGYAAAQFAQEQLFHYVQYNLYQKLQLQLSFEKSDPPTFDTVQQYSTLPEWDQFESVLSESPNTKSAALAI